MPNTYVFQRFDCKSFDRENSIFIVENSKWSPLFYKNDLDLSVNFKF